MNKEVFMQKLCSIQSKLNILMAQEMDNVSGPGMVFTKEDMLRLIPGLKYDRKCADILAKACDKNGIVADANYIRTLIVKSNQENDFKSFDKEAVQRGHEVVTGSYKEAKISEREAKNFSKRLSENPDMAKKAKAIEKAVEQVNKGIQSAPKAKKDVINTQELKSACKYMGIGLILIGIIIGYFVFPAAKKKFIELWDNGNWKNWNEKKFVDLVKSIGYLSVVAAPLLVGLVLVYFAFRSDKIDEKANWFVYSIVSFAKKIADAAKSAGNWIVGLFNSKKSVKAEQQKRLENDYFNFNF